MTTSITSTTINYTINSLGLDIRRLPAGEYYN